MVTIAHSNVYSRVYTNTYVSINNAPYEKESFNQSTNIVRVYLDFPVRRKSLSRSIIKYLLREDLGIPTEDIHCAAKHEKDTTDISINYTQL